MKDTKTVMYPNVARKLLSMGYQIVDLRPKKEDRKETLFVFKVDAEGKFWRDFDKLMSEFEAEKEVNKE